MKKLLLISGVAVLSFAANYTLVPWGAYSNYEKTGNDNSAAYGLYFSTYSYPFKVEAQLDRFVMNFLSNAPDYRETGLGVKLTYYIGSNWAVRGGFKGIRRENAYSLAYNLYVTYMNKKYHYSYTYWTYHPDYYWWDTSNPNNPYFPITPTMPINPTNPIDTNPTDTNPTDTNPTNVNPTDTNPTETNPTDTTPTNTNPTNTNPTTTEETTPTTTEQTTPTNTTPTSSGPNMEIAPPPIKANGWTPHTVEGDYTYKIPVYGVDIQKTSLAKYIYTATLGVMYYQFGKYNLNLDGYFTNYKDFKVYQLTPKAGYTIWYKQGVGSLYGELGLDYIHITNDAAFKDNYTDFFGKLIFGYQKYTVTLKGVVGKNSYRVTDGGFSVYTGASEYKYSYGGSVGVQFTKNLSGSLGFSRSAFEQVKGYTSYSNTTSASITLTF